MWDFLQTADRRDQCSAFTVSHPKDTGQCGGKRTSPSFEAALQPLAKNYHAPQDIKGVDPDKKVRGTDLCVTFSSWGSGGRCKLPSGVWRQTHFGTNVLKINSKSGPFSVTVYTPNSDPISDVHWLLQRKIGSVVRGCAKTC